MADSEAVVFFNKVKSMGIDADAVAKFAEDTRAKHAASPEANKVNILLFGSHGTGKSTALTTCPKPIHIDVFDRGGAKTAALQPFIDRGEVIVDTRFGEEDWWKSPKGWPLWETTFLHRLKTGYFKTLGTYAVDSLSSMSNMIMWNVLKNSRDKRGDRTGALPDRNDFNPLLYTIVGYIDKMMELPCHVVVTGHLDPPYRDEETKQWSPPALLLSGKASWKVPLAFDEKWISRVMGDKFFLQVKPEGEWHAQTRIGSAVFTPREEQNIRNLIKRAGYPSEDNEIGMKLLVRKEGA